MRSDVVWRGGSVVMRCKVIMSGVEWCRVMWCGVNDVVCCGVMWCVKV